MKNNYEIVFFGTDTFSTHILDGLKTAGLLPKLIITVPDKKAGRGLILTPSIVKKWAELNKINTLEPEKLNDEFGLKLSAVGCDLFVVASYGKIIPQAILDIPKHKVLNVHPSLLPKYRGATPIQSQILSNDKNVGVTIMLIDAEVDHGPIICSSKIYLEHWPVRSSELETILGKEGGKILSDTIPRWVDGSVTPIVQNHQEATFTKKIKKEDGLLDLSSDHYKNFLKFCAYENSIGVYFIVFKRNREIKVKITDAYFNDGIFKPKTVVPEGGRKMLYEDFLRGLS